MREKTKHWLENIPVKAELDGGEKDKVLELLDHPGLPLFLGLLLGERQGYLMQLAQLQLGDPAASHRASVLQGLTQGLTRVPQTLLELVPGDSPHEQE